MDTAWQSTATAAQPVSDDFESRFLDKLREDIEHNRIVLPSLPDVALKVRQVVDDPNATADKVASVVGTDPAMSARLLKVANSPLYRRAGTPIEDVRTAVTRLGMRLVRTLITNLAIVQVMRPPQGSLAKHLQHIFEHSLETATLCYALAARYTRISPDQAMLAGIVHDIGYLPILQYGATRRELMQDEERLKRLLYKHHADVGAMVMRAWGFAEDFVDAVTQHEDVYRAGQAEVDLVDIIVAAELNVEHEEKNARVDIDRGLVPALRKLGVDPDAVITDDEQTRELIEEARQLLSI